MPHPHLRPHARTVQMVRLLRAAAPAMHRRRGGHLPRQQQPDAIRLEYAKDINARAVEPAVESVRRELPELLRLLEEGLRAAGRLDAGEEGRARALVDRAARRAADAENARELHRVAEQFGKRTEGFQREQLDRQVRQAVGVPLAAVERPTVDRVGLFASANVELIRTVPDRYFSSVQKVVQQAFAEGWGVDRLTDEVAYRGEVAESDARRIARDQVGKLAAQVNQDRQESLGVTGYVWRTVKDARVRDAHSHLEGQKFDWDSEGAPGADVDGGPAHPGEPIQCRCYAEPDLSGILAGL